MYKNSFGRNVDRIAYGLISHKRSLTAYSTNMLWEELKNNVDNAEIMKQQKQKYGAQAVTMQLNLVDDCVKELLNRYKKQKRYTLSR